jgi:chromosome partitioning protein
MIVTVANLTPESGKTLLSENLALLRARGGRKVLLLDADPRQTGLHWCEARARSRLRPQIATRTARGHGFSEEIERLQARFDDIVIDTAGCTSYECRCALIAAQVVVVPLAPEHADLDKEYRLIAQLNSARMFNPGLRVLFVATSGERDLAMTERLLVHAYAGQVMSAGLAATTIHLPVLRWGADAPGRCACDRDSNAGAAEMAALYHEVFQTSVPVPPPRRAVSASLDA